MLILLNIMKRVGQFGITFMHKENQDPMQGGLLNLTMSENFTILVHFKGR
jgi:hypothetical protein